MSGKCGEKGVGSGERCMLRAEDCGGRLPEEPQVTGRCGYVDDVGVGHFAKFAASRPGVLSVCCVSSDESALLLR